MSGFRRVLFVTVIVGMFLGCGGPDNGDSEGEVVDHRVPDVPWEWKYPSPYGSDIGGVAFYDANSGVALTNWSGTMLRTENGGKNWGRVESAFDFETSIYGFAAHDAETWMTVGPEGAVKRTEDGGETWMDVGVDDDVTLSGIAMLDASTAVAVGGSLSIYRTTNGGESWNEKSVSGVISTATLGTVQFDGSGNGIALAADDILVTNNGGKDWSDPDVEDETGFDDVAFLGNGTVIGVGDQIRRSEDGGSSWTTVDAELGDIERLAGVGTVDASAGSVGAVAENGDLFWSEDGGRTWSRYAADTIVGLDDTSPKVRTVAAPGNNLVALGDAGTLLHTSGGPNAWNRESPQAYVGEQVMGEVQFEEDFGVVLQSRDQLLRTTNGGESWLQTDLTSGYEQTDDTVGFNLNGVGFPAGGTNDDEGAPAADDIALVVGSIQERETSAVVGSAPDSFEPAVAKIEQYQGSTFGLTVERLDHDVESLYDVAFDGNVGLMTAESDGDEEKVTILRTEDGGESWSTVASELDKQIWEVALLPDEGAWLGRGSNALYVSTDAGSTWETRYEFDDGTSTSAIDIGAGGRVAVAGTSGRLFLSQDNGQSFARRETDLDVVFEGIQLTGDASAVVVGEGGHLADVGPDETTTGRWHPEYGLLDVEQTGAGDIIAVGGGGTMIEYIE